MTEQGSNRNDLEPGALETLRKVDQLRIIGKQLRVVRRELEIANATMERMEKELARLIDAKHELIEWLTGTTDA